MTLALVVTGLPVALSSGSGPVRADSAERISFPFAPPKVAPRRASTAAQRRGYLVKARSLPSPVPSTAARSGGIPAGMLGTWGGQIALAGGIPEHLLLSLSQPGTPGSQDAVGAFSIQAADCQGNILFDGVSAGAIVSLHLEQTADPNHLCPSSIEADVQLAGGGSVLDYEVIAADTMRGTWQNPLARGTLARE